MSLGALSVHVQRSTDSQAISGASVNPDPWHVGTDPDPQDTDSYGDTMFSSLEADYYDISVTAAGYQNGYKKRSRVQSGQTTNETISLVPL